MRLPIAITSISVISPMISKSTRQIFYPIPKRLRSSPPFPKGVLAKIGCEDRLWDKLTNQLYLGAEEWCKTMRAQVESKVRSTDHPQVQRAVGRPKMHKVMAAVAKAAGETVETIRHTQGHILRNLVAWLGWHEGWVTLRSIAASLRLRSEGHISYLIKRCETVFADNTILLDQHDRALAALRG
jgi:hypothetical protein